MIDGDGVGDARGLAQGGFAGGLDEDHIDDADHFTAFDVVHRAPAIARVSHGVELENTERAGLGTSDDLGVETTGIGRREDDGGNRRNDAPVGNGEEAQDRPDGKAREGDFLRCRSG